MSNSPLDAGIPVLTEIIPLPAAPLAPAAAAPSAASAGVARADAGMEQGTDVAGSTSALHRDVLRPARSAEPAAPVQPVEPAGSAEAADIIEAAEADAAPHFTLPSLSRQEEDARWEKLEREVRERVLYQLMERIDFVLEQRVRDSLADVLQIAVEKLATEIKGGLRETVKEVVTRAVAQEITKLQATKK
jgi:hypothetical protein